MIDNPNVDAEKEVLEKYGLSVERVLDQFTQSQIAARTVEIYKRLGRESLP